MSSERPMARSPLTWHTPPTHQDKMYRCTTGNLMNNLEINPLLQGYGRNVGMPLGSVDLSLSSATRSTPSPKATHTNVQSQSSLAPQSSQSTCSSSLASTLPSNIPSPSIYNMAGDSGLHSTNHQTRTSAATNSSAGVIQSTTTTVAALKERMQGTSSYLGPALGSTMNCFGGNTNTIGDGGGSGGNGFGADLTHRAANDPTTLVTGGLLIKDAKQINSEMDNKNGRDCFPHLPAADSAELVKEFIMQTMQNSNALSVSPKRSSPARSSLHPIPSPSRSRSPPLNLLLAGSVAMDGKLGVDCLSSTNLPLPSATESTDSGNSSGAALSVGSLLPGCSQGPNAGVSTAMPANNNPAASPTNNSITSSEDSVDSLNGRSNARRRRKPERTSKMNAAPAVDGSNAFFPIGKSVDGPALGELEALRPGSVVRGDISALAIEGINALTHGLAVNDGHGPGSNSVRTNSAHHGGGGGGRGPQENHSAPRDPATVRQHSQQDNLHIQSNMNSSTAKAGPSIHSSPPARELMSGNGSTDLPNDGRAVSNSAPSSKDSAIGTAGDRAQKEGGPTKSDTIDYDALDKIAAMVSSETVVGTRISNKGEESLIGNGTAVDAIAPARNCNGPREGNPVNGGKTGYQQGNKTIASDSSYEEVENKLEEMFAGIEELPGKTGDSDASGVTASNRNNGCQNPEPVGQQAAENRPLPPSGVTDGDVLKQLSCNDSIALDGTMTEAGVTDAVDSGAKSGKKPLTPAQKRGNGTKSLAGEMVTSTPAPAKRKRAPKKKSSAHGNSGPFPDPEAPTMPGLKALAAKKKKGKKGKSTSPGSDGGGRTGKKGNVGKKGKGGGNKNNEQQAASSSMVWSASAPSIDTSGKYKGPYVQVKSDGSHTVINTPINDEDGEKAQNKTKKFGSNLNNSERSKIRGLHVSTLSTKYDADTTDTSWMCVFCKTGPHKFRLGDLFGPYIISTTSSEFVQSQVDMDFFSIKRTRETLESQQAKEKREQQLQELGAVAALKQEKHADEHRQQATADMFYGMVKAGDSTYEVWTHEDCLVWAPGVYMVGTRIVGLEAAIWNCCRHQCELCTHYGAVVSCLRQGCSSKAHFICAHKQNWKMTDDFQSFCARHADQSGSEGVQSTTVNDAAAGPSAPAHVHRNETKPDKDTVNLAPQVS
ncbi:AGAP005259-PA-like protein [Anopheles sinensis]|uniref:AGAP005259-PA-like protein n=1 Tax=Anopheles sinensis TaxID=74873 RepID=A0A084W9M8_ANOSI|nr:AGAP005259-PA-like protein [Anopheles sinensis]